MSDNSSLISGIQDSDQEEREVNQKFLSINKSEQIKALAHEKQSWGKNKNQYYKQNEVSDNSEGEQDEEAEAEELQLIAKKKLNDVDFWDINDNEIEEDKPVLNKNLEQNFNKKALISLSECVGIEKEQLCALSQAELSEKVFQGWPELMDIVQEIDEKGKELKLLKLRSKKEQGNWNRKHNQIKLKILSNYLGLLFFYLQLRSHSQLNQQHPIFQMIIEMRDLLDKCDDNEKFAQLLQMHTDQQKKEQSVDTEQEEEIEQESNNQPEILDLKQKLNNIYNKQTKKELNKIDKVKNLLEGMDKQNANLKKSKQEKQIEEEDNNSMSSNLIKEAMNDMDDLLSEGEDEIYKQNKERLKNMKQQKKTIKKEEKVQQFSELSKLQKLREVKEDDPRKITYVMLKNISLMRRRRGQKFRNSRVKHRVKYEKAVKKLKSMNKFIKNPIVNKYEGENGIKSGIIKSVRLQ